MKIFLQWSIILAYSNSSQPGIIRIVQNNVIVENSYLYWNWSQSFVKTRRTKVKLTSRCISILLKLRPNESVRDENQFKLDREYTTVDQNREECIESFRQARPVATKCPPVNSRFSFSFGSGWRLLFYKGSKVIILDMLFFSSAIIKGDYSHTY